MLISVGVVQLALLLTRGLLVWAGLQMSMVSSMLTAIVTVVGIALSPEYVFAIRGGDPLPDDRQFGVLWVPRAGLAAAR
jgi:putative ABC transport system permease protein